MRTFFRFTAMGSIHVLATERSEGTSTAVPQHIVGEVQTSGEVPIGPKAVPSLRLARRSTRRRGTPVQLDRDPHDQVMVSVRHDRRLQSGRRWTSW